MNSTCIGQYLILEEPNGEATAYRDGEALFQKDFGSYEEAKEWATGEVELESAGAHDRQAGA